MNVAVDTRKVQNLLGDISVIRNSITGLIEIQVDNPETDSIHLINIKLNETQALSFGLALTEIALGKLS